MSDEIVIFRIHKEFLEISSTKENTTIKENKAGPGRWLSVYRRSSLGLRTRAFHPETHKVEGEN